ncbi:hypothetical protein CPL00363_CDS0139 [Klebsiella phage Torridgeon]
MSSFPRFLSFFYCVFYFSYRSPYFSRCSRARQCRLYRMAGHSLYSLRNSALLKLAMIICA